MRVLITGRNGQLAQALLSSLQGVGELTCLGRAELDLADVHAVLANIRALRPDLIINAAAYTAVDAAEPDAAQAFAINATAPGVLAEEAKALGVPLIHYSTDYVFDGTKDAPYVEEDAPHPLSIYGQSKLAGEQAVVAAGGDFLILRTSWVYSRYGRNFLLTMQRLLQERDEVRVVSDQIGAPTWAGTVATTTRALIDRWQRGTPGPWGTYHLTALGETSWFGFASAIGEQLKNAGKPCARLVPIASSEYPTPAQRPLNSRLACSRLQSAWDLHLPHWQTALADCLHDAD